MKILDYLTWIMFIFSLLLTLCTIIVLFGLAYMPALSSLKPLQISLAVTFFMWGVNNLYNNYAEDGKKNFFYCTIIAGIFLVFVVLGIY
ncbi:hypothetical protein Q428_11185 [Fervidicella metallireducens AeB]|uniref:Uncharacterized protein n=1 Tax=Fervidicella metallireducens AeB TaxID=1403537 RepID=A0A017RT33_9CLOT|nr:hypothetical protein [Fervidicella metallireducens]EYE87832.1 hypothetical protein Q428_11185 [Fervidicella metallireducens AeB]